jgi:hypothetical protein
MSEYFCTTKNDVLNAQPLGPQAFFYTQEWHLMQSAVKFIEKYTNAVIVVAELEAWIAMALVRANCINTCAIVAYVGMAFAFIYVQTGVPCRC